MVALSAVGIIIAFVLLIGGSWKKISMFLVAVVCAGIIGATGGLGFLEAIKGPYMDGFTDFVKSWAVIIALGALLGSLYGKSGAAWRIGDVLIAKAGSSLALLVYVLVGALLVYCGIAVPVTLFVLLPFAKVIFPRAGIPWSLFPAVTGLGVATFAMYTPGSLQVINLIPTQYYGISTMAAPLEGFASSAFLLIVGILYLRWEIKRNSKNLAMDGPEQYIVQGDHVDNAEMAEKAPPFLISLIPVVGAALVWGPTAIYLLLTGHYWQGAALIAYGACVIGLADNLLRPVLVGRDTKLPDFLVLLSTLGGFMMFGMDGFVTGPTLAVLFVTVWQIFMEECGRGDCETIALTAAEKPASLCSEGDGILPPSGGESCVQGEKTEVASSGSVSQNSSGKEEG